MSTIPAREVRGARSMLICVLLIVTSMGLAKIRWWYQFRALIPAVEKEKIEATISAVVTTALA
jgi:hypothetical protein